MLLKKQNDTRSDRNSEVHSSPLCRSSKCRRLHAYTISLLSAEWCELKDELSGAKWKSFCCQVVESKLQNLSRHCHAILHQNLHLTDTVMMRGFYLTCHYGYIPPIFFPGEVINLTSAVKGICILLPKLGDMTGICRAANKQNDEIPDFYFCCAFIDTEKKQLIQLPFLRSFFFFFLNLSVVFCGRVCGGKSHQLWKQSHTLATCALTQTANWMRSVFELFWQQWL